MKTANLLLVILVSIAAPLLTIAAPVQQWGELSEPEIQAAIQLGSTGSPEPYPLRWRMGRKPYTVVAAVYTPFVRVACWVRLQDGAEHVRVNDIPKDLMTPVLIVAVPDEPRCCTPPLAVGPPTSVRAALAPTIVNRNVDTHAQVVMISDLDSHPATWSTTDVSFLRRFDPTVAARTSALVAFQTQDVRAGYTIVLEQRFRALEGPGIHTFMTNGNVVQEDVADWR